MFVKPLTLCGVLALAGCDTLREEAHFAKAPAHDSAAVQLAEAADSVSRSLFDLAKIQEAAQHKKPKTLFDPSRSHLKGRASIDWAGPMKTLVERVAKASGHKLRVLGKAPAVPVHIALKLDDHSYGDILRHIDYLAGNYATLKVYTKPKKIIELRYAQS